MATPDTVLRSVKEAIKSSGRLPRETSYAIFELDMDGGQANVRPPVVEITTVDTIRSTAMNTDFVGYATDNAGNDIGYIYRAGFEMPVQIDVLTAEGDPYDPNELGTELRRALYRYEDRQYDDGLPDPDSSGVLEDVTGVTIDSGSPVPDLDMTPALRRWRQSVTVTFEEVIDTSSEYEELDYIDTVHTPGDDDVSGGSTVEITFDATPSQTSPADSY